jgi:CRISPR system Cascade subunit CasD
MADHNTLVLRLDAALMSFGGVVLDGLHPTLRFPIRSLFGGLLGNALGYDRSQFDLLEALQKAFTYGSRWDVEPTLMRDYQTVDMGSVKMRRKSVTSQGALVGRDGGNKEATHQTERMYWSGGVLTAVLHFADATWVPQLAHALRRPARPLFYGRKTCIPSAPPLRQTARFADVLDALTGTTVSSLDMEWRADTPRPEADVFSWTTQREGAEPQAAPLRLEADLPAMFAARLGHATSRETVPARMDMRNRIHVGQESRVRAMLEVTAETETPLHGPSTDSTADAATQS